MTTNCTLEDVLGVWNTYIPEEQGYLDVEYAICFDNVVVSVNKNATLPRIGRVEFTGQSGLHFDKVATISGNSFDIGDGESMYTTVYVGKMMSNDYSHLAVTFSPDAIAGALSERRVEELNVFNLAVGLGFITNDYTTPPSDYEFVFGDARVNDSYTYSAEQSFKNVGYIRSIKDFERDTAALYLTGVLSGAGDGSWVKQNLAVAFVGSAAELPTPEPTTGTLSLLALAGLAARRRRK